VLRVGTLERPGGHLTERAALRLAADCGVPTPRLLAVRDLEETRVALTLIEHLDGSSAIPSVMRPARLRALGTAMARLHAVALEPTPTLPERSRPIATVDFAKLRREHGANALLHEAEERVAAVRPAAPNVFVHGDLWQGNTLWNGDTLIGVVDWDCAGTGPAGVDLGSVRLDAALCYGPDAAEYVLACWEQEAGRQATDVAYWDAVAALATPPDLGWFPAAMAGQGRSDLTRHVLTTRRDAFLRDALARLPG
jgi:aminoglycoside phosphotransferase (APT) family kinase protein